MKRSESDVAPYVLARNADQPVCGRVEQSNIKLGGGDICEQRLGINNGFLSISPDGMCQPDA
jgi:hypothetical protein